MHVWFCCTSPAAAVLQSVSCPCLQKVDVLVNNAGKFPGKPGPTNGNGLSLLCWLEGSLAVFAVRRNSRTVQHSTCRCVRALDYLQETPHHLTPIYTYACGPSR